MRSFTTIPACLAFFAVGVLSAPWARGGQHQCLSYGDAQQVATNFKDLIATYSDALADEALSPNFTDWSSSVNTLINSGGTSPQPLLGPTFSSLAAFKAGQGSQPPIPFEQLNIWHNCDTVIIRWKSDPPVPGTDEPVVGIIVLETVPAPAGNKFPYYINTVYSEFNSGAWLVDLGVFKPNSTTAASRMRVVRTVL